MTQLVWKPLIKVKNMASLESFQIQGNTVLVAASSSTASAATQVSTGGQQAAWLVNPTTSPVFVSVGVTSAIQAAVPTTSVPAPGLCITNVTPKVITIPPTCWLSAATSAGAASLFVTPGFGN
jgi:hypothetical protein